MAGGACQTRGWVAGHAGDGAAGGEAAQPALVQRIGQPQPREIDRDIARVVIADGGTQGVHPRLGRADGGARIGGPDRRRIDDQHGPARLAVVGGGGPGRAGDIGRRRQRRDAEEIEEIGGFQREDAGAGRLIAGDLGVGDRAAVVGGIADRVLRRVGGTFAFGR